MITDVCTKVGSGSRNIISQTTKLMITGKSYMHNIRRNKNEVLDRQTVYEKKKI